MKNKLLKVLIITLLLLLIGLLVIFAYNNILNKDLSHYKEDDYIIQNKNYLEKIDLLGRWEQIFDDEITVLMFNYPNTYSVFFEDSRLGGAYGNFLLDGQYLRTTSEHDDWEVKYRIKIDLDSTPNRLILQVHESIERNLTEEGRTMTFTRPYIE